MSEKKWKALEIIVKIKRTTKLTLSQEADQLVLSQQQSFEWIVVKDSEGVEVHTTDTQVAVSLQAAIQVAIAVVIKASL